MTNELKIEMPGKLSDHSCYHLVLRMVLWGENRDEVYERLAVNGVTGELADELYGLAWADRIRTIRGEYFGRMLGGLGLMVVAAVIFSGCWFGLGFIPRVLLYLCFGGLGIGSWKVADGLLGCLMASSKTGSVADGI